MKRAAEEDWSQSLSDARPGSDTPSALPGAPSREQSTASSGCRATPEVGTGNVGGGPLSAIGVGGVTAALTLTGLKDAL